MNIKNILFRTFAATALIWAVACEKPEMNDENGGGDSPAVEINVINGTSIEEGNNLVGLVSDSSTGKGIEGVAVSDGYSVVKTDKNGVYQFESNRYARYVFISIPSEYKVPMDKNMKPAFYKNGISRNTTNRNDFILDPLTENEDNFTLIAIGDPQVKTSAHISRYKNETIADIRSTLNVNQAKGRYTKAYAVTLGDIVHDTPNLWDAMVETMQNVKIGSDYLPVFQCIGNHDHNAKASSDLSATTEYVDHYGPTDYSFNRGKVHVVVMDNIVCTTTNGSTWTYDAGFSKSQYNWLKADLDAVRNKADMMVILCCHIPFRGGSNSGGSNVNKDKYYA